VIPVVGDRPRSPYARNSHNNSRKNSVYVYIHTIHNIHEKTSPGSHKPASRALKLTSPLTPCSGRGSGARPPPEGGSTLTHSPHSASQHNEHTNPISLYKGINRWGGIRCFAHLSLTWEKSQQSPPLTCEVIAESAALSGCNPSATLASILSREYLQLPSAHTRGSTRQKISHTICEETDSLSDITSPTELHRTQLVNLGHHRILLDLRGQT